MELVRRIYEAWDANDMETVFSITDPNIEWRPALGAALFGATVYYGHTGVARYRQEVEEVFADFHIHFRDAIDAGDQVVVSFEFSGRGRGSGVEVHQPSTHVWTVTGGRITALRSYSDRQEALEAAGVQ